MTLEHRGELLVHTANRRHGADLQKIPEGKKRDTDHTFACSKKQTKKIELTQPRGGALSSQKVASHSPLPSRFDESAGRESANSEWELFSFRHSAGHCLKAAGEPVTRQGGLCHVATICFKSL